MDMRTIYCGACAIAAVCAASPHSAAQQNTVETPFNQASHRFFERNGTGGFGQSSRRTIVTQAPVITVANGSVGSIAHATQTPFVTGLVPVVGSGAGMVYNMPLPYYPPAGNTVTYPLHDKIREYYAKGLHLEQPTDVAASELKLGAPTTGPAPGSADESSAARGDLSLAEIRRNKAARDAAEGERQAREIAVLIEHGRGAEEAGKIGVAKIYYKQAAREATGQLQQQLIDKIRSLE